MSFNKAYYDEVANKQQLNESVGPGVYMLGKPNISCEPCYPYAPSVRLDRQGNSISSRQSLIDIDSELSNITRKLSRDPKDKYIPNCPNSMCTSGEVCGQGVVGNCKEHNRGQRIGDNDLLHFKDCFIPAEETRLSNPSCNLRSTGWNRWEWLCHDPQERVMMPFDWNISNRIVVKDNHRPIIPNPISQTLVLPKGTGQMPCETIENSCANPTMPNSTSWQTADVIRKY
jgi:hypothetical protein